MFRLLVPGLTLLLLFAACETEAPRPHADPEIPEDPEARTTIDPPAYAPARAPLVDGTQTVEIAVTPQGFEPMSVSLQARTPARLVFTRTDADACGEGIQIPVLEERTPDLQVNQAMALEFTPPAGGVLQFVCGVDQLRGRLVVDE